MIAGVVVAMAIWKHRAPLVKGVFELNNSNLSPRLDVSLGTVMLFFFFQAEDGIRDYKVTGVQTCALPISVEWREERCAHDVVPVPMGDEQMNRARQPGRSQQLVAKDAHAGAEVEHELRLRSEERRVGKGVDLGGRRIIKKKKKKAYE